MNADNTATMRAWIAQARPSDKATSIFISAEKFNALLDCLEELVFSMEVGNSDAEIVLARLMEVR